MQRKYLIGHSLKSQKKEIREFEFELEIDDEGDLLLRSRNITTKLSLLVAAITPSDTFYVYRDNLKALGLPHDVI